MSFLIDGRWIVSGRRRGLAKLRVPGFCNTVFLIEGVIKTYISNSQYVTPIFNEGVGSIQGSKKPVNDSIKEDDRSLLMKYYIILLAEHNNGIIGTSTKGMGRGFERYPDERKSAAVEIGGKLIRIFLKSLEMSK